MGKLTRNGLNRYKYIKILVTSHTYQAGIYLFEINDENTRRMSDVKAAQNFTKHTRRHDVTLASLLLTLFSN